MLVITVHVFGFIVFASLDRGRVTFSNTRSLLDCRSKSGGEFRYNLHTLIVSRILGERSHRSHSESQRPFWQAGQGSADGTNRTRTKNSRISTLSPFVTMVTFRAGVRSSCDSRLMSGTYLRSISITEGSSRN